MNVFILAGSVVAILTYFPLWKQIKDHKVEQNMLSWVLWATLDVIVTGSIVFQKGNFALPLAYTIGGVITGIVIWKAGNTFVWTWFETLVLSLVFVSMAVWYASGDKVATIASTLAVLIAGIPQLIDAWKKPHDMPFGAYCGYTVANVLSVMGGKDWSVQERFYPAACTVLCLLAAMFSARKFWSKPAN